MYKSPLEVIYDKAVYKTLKDEENNMMLAIQQAIGYKVDKDELIRALQYDRRQYEQGLKDGMGQPKWISCSKREPTQTGNYLITWVYYGCSDYITRYIDIARYDSRYNKWHKTENMLIFNSHTKIIAWMPLPEPYEEIENEADD